MQELRTADLRFTLAEATELLNTLMGLDLSPGDISALETRTEGWVVGLQLAGLSLQGQGAGDRGDFVRAFSGDDRYVADYLVDEVLRHETSPVQAFLVQTSILERLCGPLCDAVTRRQDGQAMLQHLELRERRILELRFGLDGHEGPPRTFKEIGQIVGLTRERVRQLEKKALAELKALADEWL